MEKEESTVVEERSQAPAEEEATGAEIAPLDEQAQRIAALEAELAQAQAQAQDYLDQVRRTAAEFANYRKRQERDQGEFIKQANAGLILKLLPILDDLALAFEHVPPEAAGSQWVEGFALIQRKLLSLLEQEGVTPIAAVGQPFDPALHEAVTHEESDQVASGHVIAEVRTGYRLGERVLRPAMVRVAR